jgi:hypothetical protein
MKMKRSEINKALKELEAMCAKYKCYLPPFCNFTPEEWQEKAIFIDKLRELTDRLNRCRAAYEAHTPLVSDEIYDILFSDLQTLESWLGLRMKNSPTKKGNHLV